jgi:hypothetical protein
MASRSAWIRDQVGEACAAASGVEVLPVAHWTLRYPGFPYIEWLTADLAVTSPHRS